MPEESRAQVRPGCDDSDSFDPRDLYNPRRLAAIHTGLNRAVARLALAPEHQREYLRRIGTAGSADELALEFNEAAILLEQLEEVNWIDPAQAAMVRHIDRLLDLMSGRENAHLWLPEALSTTPEWAEVRGVAKEFLFLQDWFGGV